MLLVEGENFRQH